MLSAKLLCRHISTAPRLSNTNATIGRFCIVSHVVGQHWMTHHHAALAAETQMELIHISTAPLLARSELCQESLKIQFLLGNHRGKLLSLEKGNEKEHHTELLSSDQRKCSEIYLCCGGSCRVILCVNMLSHNSVSPYCSNHLIAFLLEGV